MALDFAKDKSELHQRWSYRKGDSWYLVKYGPGYEDHFLVESCNNEELLILQRMEATGIKVQCPQCTRVGDKVLAKEGKCPYCKVDVVPYTEGGK